MGPMIDPDHKTDLTVYTLHFASAVGTAHHYTGSAYTCRLERRMIEHAHGYGSRLTALAAASNIAMYLVDTIAVSHRMAERLIKARGSAARRCPICRARRSGEPVDLKQYRCLPSPLPVPHFKALDH